MYMYVYIYIYTHMYGCMYVCVDVYTASQQTFTHMGLSENNISPVYLTVPRKMPYVGGKSPISAKPPPMDIVDIFSG